VGGRDPHSARCHVGQAGPRRLFAARRFRRNRVRLSGHVRPPPLATAAGCLLPFSLISPVFPTAPTENLYYGFGFDVMSSSSPFDTLFIRGLTSIPSHVVGGIVDYTILSFNFYIIIIIIIIIIFIIYYLK
jgi:hypothetical protein